MSEMNASPPDLEERHKQREKVFEKFIESLKPWLFEFGNWIFGGLIAFNLIIVGAILTVGPTHPEILVAIAAFACALPLNVSGLFLLKIFKDMSDVALDDVMRQAFLDANIPNVEAYFPASEEKEAQYKRRTDVGLRYALTLALVSTLLTTIGIIAALWYMAWWIGTVFLVVVIGSIILVMNVLSRWMPPQSESERELKQRYREQRRRSEKSRDEK